MNIEEMSIEDLRSRFQNMCEIVNFTTQKLIDEKKIAKDYQAKYVAECFDRSCYEKTIKSQTEDIEDLKAKLKEFLSEYQRLIDVSRVAFRRQKSEIKKLRSQLREQHQEKLQQAHDCVVSADKLFL
jgi:ElaB/YqjD/DUF883 family membrane-anchored ribosome-binding protein